MRRSGVGDGFGVAARFELRATILVGTEMSTLRASEVFGEGLGACSSPVLTPRSGPRPLICASGLAGRELKRSVLKIR